MCILICRNPIYSSEGPARASPPPARDVRHLGDFTVTPRLLRITALAVPVGVVSALAAWVLVRLIGLITNAVFYQRVDSRPGRTGRGTTPRG